MGERRAFEEISDEAPRRLRGKLGRHERIGHLRRELEETRAKLYKKISRP